MVPRLGVVVVSLRGFGREVGTSPRSLPELSELPPAMMSGSDKGDRVGWMWDVCVQYDDGTLWWKTTPAAT